MHSEISLRQEMSPQSEDPLAFYTQKLRRAQNLTTTPIVILGEEGQPANSPTFSRYKKGPIRRQEGGGGDSNKRVVKG